MRMGKAFGSSSDEILSKAQTLGAAGPAVGYVRQGHGVRARGEEGRRALTCSRHVGVRAALSMVERNVVKTMGPGVRNWEAR